MLKTTLIRLSASILSLSFVLAAPSLGQWIVNPANGHEYRLSAGLYWGASDTAAPTPPDWWDAEAEAAGYGGHLVTINDAAENAWLVSTFGGTVHLWIGLTDWGSEGSFHWSNGEPVTFLNWNPGEPNNYGGGEDAVHMNQNSAGTWNDLGAQGNAPSHPNPLRGIIERQPTVTFCFGDGSAGACPCGNNGSPGGGCQNSASTGGAILTSSGSSSLSNDTLVLTSSGELSTVLSIFLQGDAAISGVNFGDGLRCVGGFLKRLYVKNAVGGVVSAPQPGDPSISARSAALGDPIAMGATRHYQTYYRDPNLAFCANPPGNAWNISNGLSAVWSP